MNDTNQPSSQFFPIGDPELFDRSCLNRNCGRLFKTFYLSKHYCSKLCYTRAKNKRRYEKEKETRKQGRLKNAEL